MDNTSSPGVSIRVVHDDCVAPSLHFGSVNWVVFGPVYDDSWSEWIGELFAEIPDRVIIVQFEPDIIPRMFRNFQEYLQAELDYICGTKPYGIH